MITGCLVRIAGFLLLAWATDFLLFLIGAIVTGIGGALFSPALQSLVGSAAERGTIQKNDHPQPKTTMALTRVMNGRTTEPHSSHYWLSAARWARLLVRCWDLSCSTSALTLPYWPAPLSSQ